MLLISACRLSHMCAVVVSYVERKLINYIECSLLSAAMAESATFYS
jgi:hypothetical protein